MPPGPKVEHKSFGQEIVIRDVDHSDKGQYECFADNRAVSDPVSREFTVHVECKCQGRFCSSLDEDFECMNVVVDEGYHKCQHYRFRAGNPAFRATSRFPAFQL